MSETKDERSLEEKFDDLENNLKRLEDDTIPLEDAFELYQQSMKLLKDCNDEIDRVEKKVLLLRDNGETDEFSE